jgi:hypothetical protein
MAAASKVLPLSNPIPIAHGAMIAEIKTRMGVRILVRAQFDNTITITMNGKGKGVVTLPDDRASTEQITSTLCERLRRLRARKGNKVDTYYGCKDIYTPYQDRSPLSSECP